MTLPKRVRIVEVGPRDGLQNEAQPIDTATKVRLVRQLVEAGLRDVEVSAFVRPDAVPQLADAVDVFAAMGSAPHGVTYSALVPNRRGLDRAWEARVGRIAVFTAASETFVQKNIRMTIDESLAVFREVIDAAKAGGLSVRGYVSTAFVCPFEGRVDPRQALRVTEALFGLGVDEVAISDTIGAATPADVERLLDVLPSTITRDQIALHLHDTYGFALANVMAGLRQGITTYDAAVGGLGGCPFAPGAAGNLATEDLVALSDALGIETGVEIERLVDAARGIEAALGRPLASRNYRRLVQARGTD